MVNFFHCGGGKGRKRASEAAVNSRPEAKRGRPAAAAKPARSGATASRGSAMPSMVVCARFRCREAGGVRGCEVDDQPDGRHRFESDPPDAEAADFDQPGKRRRGAHQQAAVARLDIERGRRRPSAQRAECLALPLAADPRPVAICRRRRVRGSAPLSLRSERRRRGLLESLFVVKAAPRSLTAPLPPCGGGLGRGVGYSRKRLPLTPLPINAGLPALIDLPRKGGGEERLRRGRC